MSNSGGRVHAHRTYAQEFKQQVIRETLERMRSFNDARQRLKAAGMLQGMRSE